MTDDERNRNICHKKGLTIYPVPYGYENYKIAISTYVGTDPSLIPREKRHEYYQKDGKWFHERLGTEIYTKEFKSNKPRYTDKIKELYEFYAKKLG